VRLGAHARAGRAVSREARGVRARGGRAARVGRGRRALPLAHARTAGLGARPRATPGDPRRRRAAHRPGHSRLHLDLVHQGARERGDRRVASGCDLLRAAPLRARDGVARPHRRHRGDRLHGISTGQPPPRTASASGGCRRRQREPRRSSRHRRRRRRAGGARFPARRRVLAASHPLPAPLAAEPVDRTPGRPGHQLRTHARAAPGREAQDAGHAGARRRQVRAPRARAGSEGRSRRRGTRRLRPLLRRLQGRVRRAGFAGGPVMATGGPTRGALTGIRVIELADEQAEYCGLTLAGLGADVIKVEPPGGNSTRHIGPFYQDREDPERSLFFWQYNRGKRSVVLDLRQRDDRERFRSLVATADILLESTPRGELDAAVLGIHGLMKELPTLIVARTSPFGDDGPWAGFKGSDLIHLALGGVMMNCGYDPAPGGKYDLPPIAPQMWHAYHVAGEQLSVAIIAALLYRWR